MQLVLKIKDDITILEMTDMVMESKKMKIELNVMKKEAYFFLIDSSVELLEIYNNYNKYGTLYFKLDFIGQCMNSFEKGVNTQNIKKEGDEVE